MIVYDVGAMIEDCIEMCMVGVDGLCCIVCIYIVSHVCLILYVYCLVVHVTAQPHMLIYGI